MQKSGLVYVGEEYADALDSAQKVVGAKNHPDTLRRMLDAATKDPVVKRALRAFVNDTYSSRPASKPAPRGARGKAGANV